jgi:hypothetical protein
MSSVLELAIPFAATVLVGLSIMYMRPGVDGRKRTGTKRYDDPIPTRR